MGFKYYASKDGVQIKLTELQSTFEDYVQTDFGFLPRDWAIVKLADVLEEVDLRLSNSSFENLPVLSLTKNHGLILQSERFIHRIATKVVSRYKVITEGQIVYNPYVIWEGAINALKNFEAGIVSPVYAIWKVKPECDWRYVDNLLRTGYMLNEYSKYSSGAVVRRRSIKKNLFLNIQIPLPPIQEQKKIANILSTIEAALGKSNNSLSSMKELKKSLMRHIFNYGLVSLEDANKIQLKETEIGQMPKGWNIANLIEITKKTQQKDMRKADYEFKYIDVSGINKNLNKIAAFSIFKGKTSPSRARKVIETNDVIIATVRPTLRRVAVVTEDYNSQVCSTAFCVLRAKETCKLKVFVLCNSKR